MYFVSEHQIVFLPNLPSEMEGDKNGFDFDSKRDTAISSTEGMKVGLLSKNASRNNFQTKKFIRTFLVNFIKNGSC